jgi:hypothetical protein
MLLLLLRAGATFSVCAALLALAFAFFAAWACTLALAAVLIATVFIG